MNLEMDLYFQDLVFLNFQKNGIVDIERHYHFQVVVQAACYYWAVGLQGTCLTLG